MYDTQETLIRWEQSRSTGESVTLKHPLTRMLREYLDDSSSGRATRRIPLEVPGSHVEYCVEFVGYELVRREYPE
jgi:hypothetical protein